LDKINTVVGFLLNQLILSDDISSQWSLLSNILFPPFPVVVVVVVVVVAVNFVYTLKTSQNWKEIKNLFFLNVNLYVSELNGVKLISQTVSAV
jgi:hypothetical protein